MALMPVVTRWRAITMVKWRTKSVSWGTITMSRSTISRGRGAITMRWLRSIPITVRDRHRTMGMRNGGVIMDGSDIRMRVAIAMRWRTSIAMGGRPTVGLLVAMHVTIVTI
jgi:hypothetical protein